MSSLFMHDLCEICESTLIRWPGEGEKRRKGGPIYLARPAVSLIQFNESRLPCALPHATCRMPRHSNQNDNLIFIIALNEYSTIACHISHSGAKSPDRATAAHSTSITAIWNRFRNHIPNPILGTYRNSIGILWVARLCCGLALSLVRPSPVPFTVKWSATVSEFY